MIQKIWELTVAQIDILSEYYAHTLDQVDKSFWLAVGFAIVGLIVYVLAAVSILKGVSASGSLIAGTFVEGVSGLGFYLHGKSLPAMADNSKQIDRMLRYLLAYALSEKLADDDKETALSDLINAIASEK